MTRIGEWVNVSSGTGSPGRPGKNGRKMVVVVVVVGLQNTYTSIHLDEQKRSL